MAWGGPIEPAQRRESWKKEIRRGPRPGDPGSYAVDAATQDRLVATTFVTQTAFALAFAVLVLAATVFYAQYSGAVRWLLSVVFLMAAAYIVVRFVGMKARDPRALLSARRIELRATGDLRTLTTTLDRASAGLKYSQVMFAGRMKDAFLERVRVSHALSAEDLERARADPAALLEIVGDRELVVFLMESERNHRHWPDVLPYLPTRKSFVAEADRMLAKMEAWR